MLRRRSSRSVKQDQNKLRRLDPQYSRGEQKRDVVSHQSLRLDPVYRKGEQKRDVVSRQSLRLDPEYHREEQARNTISHQASRLSISSPKLLPDDEYWNIIRTLNRGQQRYFMEVIHRLKKGNCHIFDFVMGGAGVGKSHLILAIVQTLIRQFIKQPGVNECSPVVLVCAATGKAAHNVRGITLHCAFKLPPNQYGGTLARLHDDVANSLRVRLVHLKLIIIDEISMVSWKQFMQVNTRLQQIFASKLPFGGIQVLLVGDFRQIRPFAGKFIFEQSHDTLYDLIAGNDLWRNFRVFELTEIMRQKENLMFAEALNRLADGVMTSEDVDLFRSRIVSETLQPPADAIRLFGSNKDCAEYNATVHQSLDTDEALSVAYDRIQGNCTAQQKQFLLENTKSLSTKDTDGLPNTVLLKVGAIYMVSLNVDVADGLFNGSTGVLKKICYGTRGNAKIPIRVFMQFDDPLVGSMASAALRNCTSFPSEWTPVGLFHKVLTRSGHKESAQVVREQFPLLPANGITFEKSQGYTYVCGAAVCTTGRLRRDLLYVGCSRAPTISRLYIIGPFNPPKPLEPIVANEIQRLRSNPLDFSIRVLQDIPEGSLKIIFHNCQSLKKHNLDIRADYCFMAADIILLVEPWLHPSDNFFFTGFEVIHATRNRIRSSVGSVVYAKTTVASQLQCKYFSRVSENGHIDFTLVQMGSLIILVIYRSPKSSIPQFFEMLQEVLHELDTAHSRLILLGDFNVDALKKKSGPLKTLLNNSNLSSKMPTDAASTDGDTQIDWCYSNFDVDGWYYESVFSYHKPICVNWAGNSQISTLEDSMKGVSLSHDENVSQMDIDPNGIILPRFGSENYTYWRIGDISLSLIDLKSLATTIERDELAAIKLCDPGFVEGFLTDQLIYSVLSILTAQTNSLVLPPGLSTIILSGDSSNVVPGSWLSYESIFWPICINNHWILLVVKPKNNRILFLDPLTNTKSYSEIEPKIVLSL